MNFYCRSVAEEHDPRGPEGPYQFKDRSVPLLIIKKWDGESLVHQLGFQPNPEQGTPRLASFIDKAIKANGPVSPPKALKPLIKSMEKASKFLGKDKPGPAWKELAKVVKLGADTKKFPEGPPTVARKAQEQLEELMTTANDAIDAAVSEADIDAEAGAKALKKLKLRYAQVPELRKRIAAELKKLAN